MHLRRNHLLVALGLVAITGISAAHAQVTRAPAQWSFSARLLNNAEFTLAMSGEGRGYSTCQEAGEASLVRSESSFLPGQTLIRFDPYPCDQNVITWLWRDSFQPPNDPNRQNQMVASCPNGGLASFDSTFGWWCPISTAQYLKNFGDCPDCDIGNPIHPGFGNKVQREVDYVGMGPFPLRFERVINNASVAGTDPRTDRAGLGINWTHTYYRLLRIGGPTTGAVMLVSADRPDGRVFVFNRSGSAFVGEPDVVLSLEQTATGWRLTNEADEVELYNPQGRLLSISSRSGQTHTLNYWPDGTIASITDSFGRSLTFQYDVQQRIRTMSNPGGDNTPSHTPTASMEIVPIS